MRELIDAVFVAEFDDPLLAQLDDQAIFELPPGRVAFTTDSFVVDPIFFPGGDIGELAVNGTVNDLAMGGARPLYMSVGMILEEGLPLDHLRRIAQSMKRAATRAGVRLVTGDTKVVARGSADKIFINTSGIGVVQTPMPISSREARAGDRVLLNGTIGDHGMAVMLARGDLAIDSDIRSDTAALWDLVRVMLEAAPDGAIRTLRDATRGGVATVCNEIAQGSSVHVRLDEESIPVGEAVRGACDILGLDPLYVANEGKLVAIVDAAASDAVLAAMRAHPLGRDACCIGTVEASPVGLVGMRTAFGGTRLVDMLVGEQLPRIC
jgi:hydrogenase expression/formation protein HypE